MTTKTNEVISVNKATSLPLTFLKPFVCLSTVFAETSLSLATCCNVFVLEFLNSFNTSRDFSLNNFCLGVSLPHGLLCNGTVVFFMWQASTFQKLSCLGHFEQSGICCILFYNLVWPVWSKSICTHTSSILHCTT